MRVDGLIFADEDLMRDIRRDEAVQQVANVAQLPGIVGRSIGMPDIHWGYGFAIGGVAAFDPAEGGVISPGGVGYDINCGVRLLRSTLQARDVGAASPGIMDRLFETIPAGVGKGYKKFVLGREEIRAILTRGAAWAVDNGFGTPRGSGPDRGRGRHLRSGPGSGERSGHPAGPGPGRNGGERESLHRGGGGGGGLRLRAAERLGLGEGPGHRVHPLRFPGVGLPGLRRLSGRHAPGLETIWHRSTGPTARLRASGLSGSRRVSGGHAGGGQLRLRESADDGTPGP